MILKIFGVAVVELAVYAALRRTHPEFAVLTEIAAAVLVFLIAADSLGELKAFFDETVSAAGTDPVWAEILLKVLGTALVTQFAADAARDNGQSALAEKIEFAGKLLMLSLSLPVLRALLQLVAAFSNGT